MKMLRKRMGLTQAQLAARIGVSQVYISRIENGDIDGLTIGKLLSLAHILHVEPIELLDKLLKAKEKRNKEGKYGL